MSLTINISGIYCDPVAHPIAGIVLEFKTLYNSSQTQLQTAASTTTDEVGAYSVDLVPNAYSVCEVFGNNRKWLGNISIFPDSVPGTLNEYLTAFRPDNAQPGILSEMEEILEETKRVAENAGVIPCGPYNPQTQYSANDLVEYQGSQYRATTDVINIQPPAAPWELFLAAGEDGPANVLAIGEVETLPAGSEATASIVGDAPAQTLNFGIPGGEKGDTGPASALAIGEVETLPAGSDATATITGDAPDQILNMGIPAGRTGGAGPANVLTIGEIETLPAGSEATATIAGESPEQTLSLGIPAGNAGPANSLAIGEVTTLPAGSQATATITGDAPEQILNLGLPKGDTGSGSSVTLVPSGQEIDPLTAAEGNYYLQPGAILRNGPASVSAMFNALVTIRIQGVSVNLIAFCHFNQTSGYLHYGEWELMDSGSSSLSWSSIGPGDSSNPGANKGFTITDVIQSQPLGMLTVPDKSNDFVVLLAGKVYDLLTEDEEAMLSDMTRDALAILRKKREA